MKKIPIVALYLSTEDQPELIFSRFYERHVHFDEANPSMIISILCAFRQLSTRILKTKLREIVSEDVMIAIRSIDSEFGQLTLVFVIISPSFSDLKLTLNTEKEIIKALSEQRLYYRSETMGWHVDFALLSKCDDIIGVKGKLLSDLTRSELIGLYILDRSNLPLFAHSFLREKPIGDSALLSAWLGSLLNLLQTVTQHVTITQATPTEFIDQGDIKVVVEKKPEEFLTAILFTTVYDLDIRKRLQRFLNEFVTRYREDFGKWFGDASTFGEAIEIIPLVFGERLPKEMRRRKQ